MNGARIYTRSLIASWVGYGANLVVMLFLSRLVVHGLGKTAYGAWSLMMTVTGYLGLAEIGVRVSTGRFINYYLGRGRQDEVNRVVSTSLAFYTLVSLAVLALAVGLGLQWSRLFPRTPPPLARQARWVLLLAAANVWMGFMASVFGQLLQARNRFDLRSVVMVTALAARAAGTVLVLRAGGGLVPLAAILTASSAVSLTLFLLLARWKGSAADLAWRHVSRRTFVKVFRYGTWAFMQNLSLRIIAYTDAVLIALLLGMEEVALYSIGLALAVYGSNFVAYVFRVIVPDAAKAAGRNDLPALRWYILQSTRVSLLLAVPVFVGLMALGGDFIRIWMGPGFEASGWVLLILAFAHLAGMLRWASTEGLKALGFVKVTASIGMAEAVLNLLFSVGFVLALGWGIYGVAAGTLVPSVLFGGTVTVWQVRKRIRLPVRLFLRQLLLPTVAAGGAFAVLCLAARRLVAVRSWPALLGAAAVLGAAYLPIALIFLLRGRERSRLFQKVLLVTGRAGRYGLCL